MKEPLSEDEITRFYIIIPQDRIGAIIGPDGVVKSRLEKEAGVNLEIDSESGEVCVSSAPKNEDPFLVLKARDFVHAVGRGFNPQVAFTLLQDDVYLEIINLKIVIGNNPNKIRRMRGRVIGKEGRTRKVIEETTKTKVMVYGNTIGIIGDYQPLRIAKEAIYMLLDRAKHGTVYRFLEENAQLLRMSSTELWDRASKDVRDI